MSQGCPEFAKSVPENVFGGPHTLAERAISLASKLGSPVLLRAVVEVPVTDPVRWASLQPDPNRVLWSDGRTGLQLGAVGAIRRVRAETKGFSAARRFLEHQRRHLVQGWYGSGQAAVADIPLALGGFSFKDEANQLDQKQVSPWQDWPRHILTIPELMLIRWSHTPTLGVIAQEVAPDDPVDSVALRLAEATQSIDGIRSMHPAAPPSANFERGRQESKESWCHRVRTARDVLKDTHEASDLKKVVLARSSTFIPAASHVFDPIDTLRHLRQHHPDAFVFAFSFEGCDDRWFVGASPELLARVASKRFEGHALAGTIANNENEELASGLAGELRDSVKNQYEHAIVLRAIESTLGAHCDPLEIAGKASVRRLTELQHLETAVRGRLKPNSTLLDLVGDLHPTPAVGGFPPATADRYLDQREELDRGWYASPVGWIGAGGDGMFAVALRCAMIEPRKATAFAGAGIVKESVPESEWEETELKLQTITSALRVRQAR